MDASSLTTEHLVGILNRWGPVICAGQKRGHPVGHSIVMIGVGEEGVIVHDPWSGPNKLWSLEDFKEFMNEKNDPFMICAMEGAKIGVQAIAPRNSESTHERLQRRMRQKAE